MFSGIEEGVPSPFATEIGHALGTYIKTPRTMASIAAKAAGLPSFGSLSPTLTCCQRRFNCCVLGVIGFCKRWNIQNYQINVLPIAILDILQRCVLIGHNDNLGAGTLNSPQRRLANLPPLRSLHELVVLVVVLRVLRWVLPPLVIRLGLGLPLLLRGLQQQKKKIASPL